jgi:transcriptional regulator with XRE-family HTH domain
MTTDTTHLPNIGKRLREARTERGLTQPELARQLKVSKQLVSAWERGTTEFLSGHLLRASKLLGFDIHWLLTGRRLR